MISSVDFAPLSVDAAPASPATATPASAGIQLTRSFGSKSDALMLAKPHQPQKPSVAKKQPTAVGIAPVDDHTATPPPAYDYPTRDSLDATPSAKGMHNVHAQSIQLGYHHIFAQEEHAANFQFVSYTTSLGRMELDALVKQWIAPAAQGKPAGAEGIFCGQISCHYPLYTIAVMASVLQCRVYCITPKFKTDTNNGRVKGHVEFWVDRGNSIKFTSKTKGLICCEMGGFYVATTLKGSKLMQSHSLHVPPTKVGIPQWPVTLEPRKSSIF